MRSRTNSIIQRQQRADELIRTEAILASGCGKAQVRVSKLEEIF